MNKFKELNEKEIELVKKAGYVIEENKEYSEEDYERCASTISYYIMNHSKNEIPKVQKEYMNVLGKII